MGAVSFKATGCQDHSFSPNVSDGEVERYTARSAIAAPHSPASPNPSITKPEAAKTLQMMFLTLSTLST